MSAAIEHEVRFRITELEKTLAHLLAKGCQQQAEFDQVRTVFDIPHQPQQWLRLRQEGEYLTVTLKALTDAGVEEREIEVNSPYEAALTFLKGLGFTPRAEHHNYRRRLSLENSNLQHEVQVTLDTWPEIGHILEIEGESPEEVVVAVALLGLSLADAEPLEVWQLYEQDGLPAILHRDLNFSEAEKLGWGLELPVG